jgi:hypothetical protein
MDAPSQAEELAGDDSAAGGNSVIQYDISHVL